MNTREVSMDTPLKELYGIGPVTLQPYEKMGITTVSDIYGKALGHRLQEAINELREETPDRSEKYWKNLTTRSEDLIYRIQHDIYEQIEPEFFLCPITLELFKDPVITPYGHTYEKQAILEHLKLNKIDCITRKSLSEEQLYENRSLKEAVEEYKKKWKIIGVVD